MGMAVALLFGGIPNPQGSYCSPQQRYLCRAPGPYGTRSSSQFSPLRPRNYHCFKRFLSGQCHRNKGFLSSAETYRLRVIICSGSTSHSINFLSSSRSPCVHGPNGHPWLLHTRALLEQREGADQLSSSGDEFDMIDSEVDSEEDVDDGYIIQESLNLFEWPAICDQVAQFTSTPMGSSLAKDGNLNIGSTQKQSEELQDQTAAAIALAKPLDFSGIENLQGIIGDALSGHVCQIRDLTNVRSTLIGIQHVYEQLCGSSSESDNAKLSSLQKLISGCDLCSDLVHEIEHCVDSTLETVLDRASPALAAARLSRKANMRALESLLKESATWVVQQGGMDSVVVTRRRARSCIAVRSSHKNLLPGGLTLDVSNTGTTSFMEPEPALGLNNEEMRLAGVEKAEELAVLRALTMKLVDRAELIMDLMGRIIIIDLACAKGSHARWLESVRPSFLGDSTLYFAGKSETPRDELMVDIDGIRHPLLLGSVLPNLPVTERIGFMRPIASRPPSGSKPEAISETPAPTKRPVPVDIKVQSKVRVVTITGPNTGGKTATLKTLGVAALMAKAGLFLPAVGQPKLPWFDIVLADVGDEQSLERSLSTFSGHIRRLRSILETSTSHSLVLLDEIGGGTDPTEGAALATAVLRHLSSKVRLCIATTHSAELKVLKDEDTKFENASVEFDIKTLRPTYKVLWGIAGQSNALDIAESLGFDKEVLSRARDLLVKMKPSQLGVRTMELLVPLVKQRDEQLERARQAFDVLAKAKELHNELSVAAANLPKRETSSKRIIAQAIDEDVAKAKSEMERIIERFQEAHEKDDPPSIKEVHAEIVSIVEKYSLEKELSGALAFLPAVARSSKGVLDRTPAAETLTVGEVVVVRRLGKTPVTVVEIPQDTEFLTVQLGSLKMQVKASEVIRARNFGSNVTLKSSEQVSYKTNSKQQLRAQAIGTEVTDSENFEVAVQTSRNTVDLRGMRVDDAMRELNMVLSTKRPKSVLFVVHGVGTGAVKEAALQALRKHPYVSKFEEESLTNAGCTIVYIK